jgi:hypothetical protein
VLDQGDLNDLVRDLKLSKHSSELLGSRLRAWNLLQKNTKITDQRKRSHEFQSYFTNINGITFCCNVTGLMQDLFGEYDSTEWRLFIDGSVKSLIAVLLHNGNEKPSVPVAHAVDVKESYESMKNILSCIRYSEHKWIICADLKVVALLLGMQLGFTKNSCFLCLWDSRARDQHYKKKVWPVRKYLEPGKNNVVCQPLVERNAILLPPLHIKLGLFQQFVKALPKDGATVNFMKEKFPKVKKYSNDRLRSEIFICFSRSVKPKSLTVSWLVLKFDGC